MKDGLLKAKEATVGNEHLYIGVSCGIKGESNGCVSPLSLK